MLGQVRVKARADQLEQLQRWARAWPDRIWAVEGARTGSAARAAAARRRTYKIAARQPKGTCARSRTTVSRGTSCAPHS